MRTYLMIALSISVALYPSHSRSDPIVQGLGHGPEGFDSLAFTGEEGRIWELEFAPALGEVWQLRVDAVLEPDAGGGTFRIPANVAASARGFYRVAGWPDPFHTGFAAVDEIPGGTYSVGRALSDSGLMVGYADDSAGDKDARPVLWKPGHKNPVELGALPGERQSWAQSVNNQGVIVGYADMGDHSGAVRYAAFAYENGVKTALPKIGGGTSVYQRAMASAVNDLDQIAGQGRTSEWGDFHAVLWTRAEGGVWNLPQDLGTLPGGNNARADAISSSGEYLAGYSNNSTASGAPILAARWRRQGGGGWNVTPIDRLGSWSGYATSVNDAGTVVGYSDPAQGVYVAFVWTESGGTVSLGTLGGNQSFPRKITDAGLIVGQAQDASGDWRGCVWEQAGGGWTIADINPLAPVPQGWRITALYDINSRGLMSGQADAGEAGFVGVWVRRTES